METKLKTVALILENTPLPEVKGIRGMRKVTAESLLRSYGTRPILLDQSDLGQRFLDAKRHPLFSIMNEVFLVERRGMALLRLLKLWSSRGNICTLLGRPKKTEDG